MEVKVLGKGCPKCKTLEKNVTEVLNELGIKSEVIKVAEINKIMEYGISSAIRIRSYKTPRALLLLWKSKQPRFRRLLRI